jgi:hypothetical protein
VSRTEENLLVGNELATSSITFLVQHHMKTHDEIKAMAMKRAPSVWPPRERNTQKPDKERVLEFLCGADVLECWNEPKDLEYTSKPWLYQIDSVRERLACALAKLPADAFEIFALGKRVVQFVVIF